jgi:hypothetical protein
MAKLQLLFLFAIFITLVLSTPVKQHRKRSFKVKRVEVPNYKADGPKAYKRALMKFGFDDISFKPDGEVANRIKAATAASISSGNEDGETPAAPTQNDAQFLSPVTVGGQVLIMNFDSGSSDTYVFGSARLKDMLLTDADGSSILASLLDPRMVTQSMTPISPIRSPFYKTLLSTSPMEMAPSLQDPLGLTL